MNQIEAAVLPLRADAIKSAEDYARALVAQIYSKLEAANWDVDVAFPRGDSMRDSREGYRLKTRSHDRACSVTTYTQSTRRPGEPNTRKASPEAVERFVTAAKEMATIQYDLFVAKLTRKIGDTTAAVLTGNHVWAFSILRVTKPDGSTEDWKTQQILNVSKLGLVFAQWPSRKLKNK